MNGVRVGLDVEKMTVKFEDVVSVKEAARLCGYSHKHVILLCNEGKITARQSGYVWLVHLPSLRDYIAAQL